MTQKILWNIDSNQVMTEWLESTVDFVDIFGLSLNFVNLFWDFTKFLWPFGDFTKFCWPFLGIRQVPWFESAHHSSGISGTWICSTHDSSCFPGVDSELTQDSSGFPRYWFRFTHDSKCIPIFSIQINSWLNQKVFDSDSTHDSTMSHTRVCFPPRTHSEISN